MLDLGQRFRGLAGLWGKGFEVWGDFWGDGQILAEAKILAEARKFASLVLCVSGPTFLHVASTLHVHTHVRAHTGVHTLVHRHTHARARAHTHTHIPASEILSLNSGVSLANDLRISRHFCKEEEREGGREKKWGGRRGGGGGGEEGERAGEGTMHEIILSQARGVYDGCRSERDGRRPGLSELASSCACGPQGERGGDWFSSFLATGGKGGTEAAGRRVRIVGPETRSCGHAKWQPCRVTSLRGGQTRSLALRI